MRASTRVTRIIGPLVVAACVLAGCGFDDATSTVAAPAVNGHPTSNGNSKATSPTDGGTGNEAVYLVPKDAADGQISGMAAFLLRDTVLTVDLELNGPDDPNTGARTSPATTADQVKAEVTALATKVRHNLTDFKHA